jgi:hypothetical protein
MRTSRILVLAASVLLIAPLRAAHAQGNGAPPERQWHQIQSAPEIDVNSSGTALALLITALLVIRGRRDAVD